MKKPTPQITTYTPMAAAIIRSAPTLEARRLNKMENGTATS